MSPGIWSNLLPHIVMTIVVPLSGLIADLLRMKKSCEHDRSEEDLWLWRFWRGGSFPADARLCNQPNSCNSVDCLCCGQLRLCHLCTQRQPAGHCSEAGCNPDR